MFGNKRCLVLSKKPGFSKFITRGRENHKKGRLTIDEKRWGKKKVYLSLSRPNTKVREMRVGRRHAKKLGVERTTGKKKKKGGSPGKKHSPRDNTYFITNTRKALKQYQKKRQNKKDIAID